MPPDRLAEICRLPARAMATLRAPGPHLRRCRSLLDELRAAAVELLPRNSSAYPPGWRRYSNAAPFLAYARGDLRLLRRPCAAVLASREITEASVGAIVTVVQHAARVGMTVASGGMKSAHRIVTVTARAAGAPRIIVLDRGILAAFGGRVGLDAFGFGPARLPLEESSALVLSPFRANDHAAPANGYRRDELVAALGDVVIAASTRPGGNIERICLEALDRGQCVFNWLGENATLLAAGATPLVPETLEQHLRASAASAVRRNGAGS